MLKFVYTLLAVTACSLLLKASGYNPRAATPQELTADSLGGKNMDPFVKVVVCAPVNVKIMPGPEHKLAITADESVKGALSTNVHDGMPSCYSTDVRFAGKLAIAYSCRAQASICWSPSH